MSLARRSARTVLAALPLALAVLLPTAGTAHATFTEDDRATRHEGNVDGGQKDACERAGLAGQPVELPESTLHGEENRFLDITAVPDGVTVTGIVVKGGDAYNVYEPGERGLPETPPWTELRAPLNKGGKIPAISHWFVCATTTPDTSTTPPTSATATPPTEPSTPGETSSSAPSSSTTTSTPPAGATTTTTPAAVAVEDTDNLASTGFDSGWLIWVGALLVLGGATVLVLLRLRRGQA
ncbi:LPXTG-motif cell wall anchor domain-containing protein [Amycolatopsis arida]|uniref:LPXTG-motif cell wall anchor domain-containing protein n=1 Tax=Amycolatopsis arida TaxID=587909 RepID=A0A1I5PK35_9PSEU|nr:LPXTG cell wall anchor domain-containing protein [Amycolatopsis arida]TDX98525.1 LPXTG-motif cell wall-anchored protein [Amycolatopsis arida]SFP34405.1 LPXTG-motif cell wall anchor domain-containing protein [Amycolatopsis arida]